MASIVKRKKKYSVVYTYTDENGNKRQKWETFETNAEAKKRKLQVEYEQESGTFIPPSAKTVNDLLDEYMSIYGVNTWAMSTYESRKSLIANYIRPLIGDMKLEDVTPRIMDKYYRDLLSVKAVSSKYVKARTEYLTPHTVREVHKTLRNAFNQAVKWELMTRNPVEHATLPKEEHKTRDIWTAEVLQKALEACDDDILRLAINLAFSCSLRMGELLGLTWDCIDISPTSIELGQASIFVEKELQRVNREAMADLDGKDIMFKFPPTFASTHTALVLKTPKTKTSVRKVFLPKTVAEMLVQRKADIEELKDLFGDEFVDFNLVFCSSNGKPIEGQVINRAFNKLIEEKGLPKVVFHSLRHSSITYKLKLNGGDMKSVQGDSGHAQVKMVADVYSHIIDDDRRLNAERMEAAFYSGRQATPEPVQPAATESSADDKELLLKLLQNPEMAALLKSLAKNIIVTARVRSFYIATIAVKGSALIFLLWRSTSMDRIFMDEYYEHLRADNIEAFSKERNDEYVGRAEEYKAAKSALLEGLGLEHLFDHSHELTPKEKEIWMLFDRVDVAELLARDAFAKGAYMLGAEDREIMLK